MQQNCTSSHCPILWSKGWQLSAATVQPGSEMHHIISMSLAQSTSIAKQHEQGVQSL